MHALNYFIKRLMDMSPQHTTYLLMSLDTFMKCLSICQPDFIQPLALHLDGMMVQADQRVVLWMLLQQHIQMLELFRTKSATHMIFPG